MSEEKPATLTVPRAGLHVSLSDTDVLSNDQDIYIVEMSSNEGRAGERGWILLSGATEGSIRAGLREGDREVEMDDIAHKDTLVTFTLPELCLPESKEVVLFLSSSPSLNTDVSFKYLPTRSSSRRAASVSSDHLIEFATTGEVMSLIQPFATFIPQQDNEGNTVLHVAARNTQSFALKTLLSAIPAEGKSEIINMRNTRGQTALHCAIRAGDPDSVHYLMNHGASSEIVDNHDNSSVHYLADAYNEAIFKEVLERGTSSVFSLFNHDGYNPLHLAVRRLKLSLVELLLESGCDLNAADKQGRTALSHSVLMNDTEIVEFLLQKGAETNTEDDEGETPLSLARQNANYPVLGLLIDAGADPKKKNKKGVALIDVDDETVQNIINGERVSLPAKEVPISVPNDLNTSRSPLFGRSVNGRKNADAPGVSGRISTGGAGPSSRPVIESADDDDIGDYSDGPSTSSMRRTASRPTQVSARDDISSLDYMTRLRLAKILDAECKWHNLAKELDCEHMIEMITICSDDSSPCMLLLDQFEQMSEASISRVRQALHNLQEAEAVDLIDNRPIY